MTDQIKLTKRAIDALKPTGKRYSVSDTEIAGFCVRVSTAGGKAYGLRYRVGGGRDGRSRWYTIGSHGKITPDQARDIAKGLAVAIAQGGDPAGERNQARNAPNVSEFLDRYIADHVRQNNKTRTQAEVIRQIDANIRPTLGKLKVSDVVRADIAKLHSSMASTPYAANRTLALLSKAFGLAEVWGLRPDNTNPCRRVQRYKEQSRERFLSDKEFAALGEILAKADAGPIDVEGHKLPVKINPQAVLAIRLLIFTGARVSEILGLRWETINWQAQRAELPDSKTGKKHLPLPPAALEVLRGLDMPENGQGYVVRGGKGTSAEVPLVNVKDSWLRLRKAAGLDDVRLHDLRHSFASVAASGGMSLVLIGSMLGHKNTATTARYAHLADDPLKAAAEKVSERIKGFLSGEEGGAEVVKLHKK
jgi:integrase